MIDKFFNEELKVQIVKYCEKLKRISTKYDVLIFMARKSICFYDALVLNNEIRRVDHDVVITTSSRVLSYDCRFLNGKRIALLDDIVLKGNTLNDTIRFLLEKGIDTFDVYYIASQSLQNGKTDLIKKYLKEPILELDSSEILVLGNAITNYISASACSYNVDYPIFYMDSENGFYKDYIKRNHCAFVPGGSAGNRTHMYVQNIDCFQFFDQYSLPVLKNLKEREREIILKIRLFYRPDAEKRKIVAIPIIVLPEMGELEIFEIFESFVNSSIIEMVKNQDKDKEISNMLSVVQYILSYQLFVSVFQNQYDFKYSIENQDYIFPRSYNIDFLSCLSKCETMKRVRIENVVINDDLFELSRIYGYFFDFIGNLHEQDERHQSKLSFKDVLEHCERFCSIDETVLRGYLSILFDYAIDTGLLVPEIRIQNSMYMRAYRLSEQYELQEEHFDLIIYMYNEYQKKTNKNEMNRILIEKLLVLYFQNVISKILNEYNSNNNSDSGAQNLFGITFARFGPVVSDSSLELGVSSDSYLTKRLFDNSRSPYKRLYEKGRNSKKVYVKQASEDYFKNLPRDWKNQTRLFVNRYDYFERILNHYDVFNTTNFIHTFDQFLIISAIGPNKDNQLLSLAAELEIYQNVVRSKNTISDVIMAVNSIMDGVANGIWKYICYYNNEYSLCYSIVAHKIEEEQRKLEYLNRQITSYRKYIDALKNLENVSGDNYQDTVRNYLEIISMINKGTKGDSKYIDYFNEVNARYKDPIKRIQILKSLISNLKAKLYDITDKLCRDRDNIDQSYIDLDKMEDFFTEHSNERNKNIEINKIVEKLMDNTVVTLYEIAEEWNYITQNAAVETFEIEISYRDKNNKYLRTIKDIFKGDEKFNMRNKNIASATRDIDSVVKRQRELVYEIDLLIFCINQYVLSNTSSFCCVQSFYIIRRDDGNVIEINEILDAKSKEIFLNKYFNFENRKNVAAINKSKQSIKFIKKLNEYKGYTLIDYECNRPCNIIVQTMDQCYSNRVKDNIEKILKEYKNKKIEIRDEE